MGTKWRHATHLATVIAAVTFAAASCSDTSTEPPGAVTTEVERHTTRQKLAALREKSGWTGDYHTLAMDHVYQALRKQNFREMSKAGKCKAAEAAFQEFNSLYRRNGKPLTYKDVSFAGTQCDNAAPTKLSKRIVLGLGTQVQGRNGELSAPAASLFAQLENVFDAEVSLSAVVSTIQDIENTAAATLDAIEAEAVIAAAEVGISSAAYWDTNLEAWQSEFSSYPSLGYDLRVTPAGVSTAVFGAPTAGLSYGAGMSASLRKLMKVDLSAALSSIMTDWWMGPISVEKAAIKGAIASALAGLFS